MCLIEIRLWCCVFGLLETLDTFAFFLVLILFVCLSILWSLADVFFQWVLCK